MRGLLDPERQADLVDRISRSFDNHMGGIRTDLNARVGRFLMTENGESQLFHLRYEMKEMAQSEIHRFLFSSMGHSFLDLFLDKVERMLPNIASMFIKK